MSTSNTVTADSVTDEEIRELRETQSPVTGNCAYLCAIALGEVELEPCSNVHPSHDCVAGQIRDARGRCAAIINARRQQQAAEREEG